MKYRLDTCKTSDAILVALREMTVDQICAWLDVTEESAHRRFVMSHVVIGNGNVVTFRRPAS